MITLLGHVAIALLFLTVNASSPQGNAPAEGSSEKVEYEYKEDLDLRPIAMIGSGGKNELLLACLDPDGGLMYIYGVNAPLPIINSPVEPKESVYEYRSGKLIKGTLSEDGSFVPDAGEKVITLSEYMQKYDPEKSLRAYNLPGTIIAADRQAGGTDKPRYEFKEDLSRWVALVWWGEKRRQAQVGHLDRAGNFVEDAELRPVLINKPFRPKEPVYEYRSGNLIKGILEENGNFVPDIGTKVFTLNEYLEMKEDPSKGLRIYNLPGRIIKKGAEGIKQDGK